MSPKLILTNNNAEKRYPNTSMWNEDGSMRMMPGWTQVSRHNSIIGRKMPYAYKKTRITFDDDDETLLWSREAGKDSKQIMVTIYDMPSPSKPEPLPLLTKRSLRQITKPNGEYSFKIDFQPCPVYKMERDDNPIEKQHAPAGPHEKHEYTLEIFYPLFKAERVEKVQKKPLDRSPRTVKGTKGKRDDWDYGDWSLNDKVADMWEASHPGTRLIRFEDGRASHPDFFEREYITALGNRHTDSSIEKDGKVGVFGFEGFQYVWKLSRHCQDVQLYEAHMERRIRSFVQEKHERVAKGQKRGGE